MILNSKSFFVSISATDRNHTKVFCTDKLDVQPIFEAEHDILYQQGDMRF